MQSLLRAFALTSLAAAAACGHKPPYGVGGQPEASALLQQTTPQLDAVAVPDATITLNRVVRADLQMLAQTDARFRASVTRSGNEFVTLAFSEEGYALRYKLDELPTGFYSGPADPCAVEAMLGVPLSYEGLVALVLGGAPVVAGATVAKQKWDRKGGYESLLLEGGGFVQELRFAWVDGAWVFSGGQMWEGTADARGRWMWTLEHDRHTTVGTAVLPGRTRIRAPGKKRDSVIVIAYKDRIANPPWSTAQPTNDGGDDGGDDTSDDGGWENGSDDGGWENEEDGGWENADKPEAPPAEAPPPSGVLASVLQSTSPSTADAAASPVPAVFKIEPAGLTDRGDLCR